jgi:hypothetical protein
VKQNAMEVDVDADGPRVGEPLAEYLAAAWRNTVASRTSQRDHYLALVEVDELFRELIIAASDGDEQLAATMLVRTHGSFLAAASLALGGQVAEAYAMAQNALRSALRGLFLADNDERQKVWLNRHDNDQTADQMRELFAHDAMLQQLRDADAATAGIYERLHQRTIDRSMHSSIHGRPFKDSGGEVEGADFIDAYLVTGDEVQRMALRTLAQVGICTLSIFYYVYGDHFRERHLDSRLAKLRHGH